MGKAPSKTQDTSSSSVWGTVFKTVFKFAVAIGLIAFLAAKGKLNLSAIATVHTQWPLLLIALALFFAGGFLNMYRWHLLLIGQNIHIPTRQNIALSFIGLFFSAAIPGTVSGDIIKSIYVAREQPEKRAASVMTIFFDRFIGFTAVVLTAFLAVFINLPRIRESVPLARLAIFNSFLMGGFILCFILIFSRRISSHAVVQRFLSLLPFSSKITSVFNAMHSYRSCLHYPAIALLLSLVTSSLNVISFYVIAKAMGFYEIAFLQYFFIVPLGVLLMAVPITPVGIGVGSAFMGQLFSWVCGRESTIGADVTLIWQTIILLFYLSGVIAYLSYRRKPVTIDQVNGGEL